MKSSKPDLNNWAEFVGSVESLTDKDKYLMFLPDRFAPSVNVGCWCHKKYKKNIVDDLLDKGISIKFRRCIRDIIGTVTFDSDPSPRLNVLYIRLTNGEYYSSDLYSKKKNEREREMLFLLAGKLGASSIECDTMIIETKFTRLNVSAKVPKIGEASAKYSKTITKKKGDTSKEIYQNRGAPTYILSKDITEVEDNILLHLGKFSENVFSNEFYNTNKKLKSFVYKRYTHKMLNVEYTVDLDNETDLNFDVEITMMDYGIGVSYDEQIVTKERLTYVINFFTDSELRLKLNERIALSEDKFAMVREIYEAQENKKMGIFHITEYVRNYANEVTFSLENSPNNIQTYQKRLERWIKKNGIEKFQEICHDFISSYQIRTWFKSELIAENEEVFDGERDSRGGINDGAYGLLKLGKNNYQQYKQVLMESDDAISAMTNAPAFQYDRNNVPFTQPPRRRRLNLDLQVPTRDSNSPLTIPAPTLEIASPRSSGSVTE